MTMSRITTVAVGLGCLASSARSFMLPVPSLVENTGSEIAARRELRASHSHPLPRMSTPRTSEVQMMPSSTQPRTWTVDPVVSGLPQQGLTPAGVHTSETREERKDGRSADFEVNLGRVISTLRNDYPRLFFDSPSFDIFTEDIELRDPTGVAFQGIANYKRVFQTLRFFRQVLMNDASTTFRLTYDWSKQQVRVTWNMVLALKTRQRPFYVDGISVYHINSQGNAYRHELETVVVNGVPVEPPFAYAWINLPAWVAQGRVARKAAPLPFPHSVTSRRFSDHSLLLAGFDSEIDMSDLVAAYKSDPDVRVDFMKALTVLDEAETVEAISAKATETGSTSAGVGSGEPAKEDEAPVNEKNVRQIKQRQGWLGGRGPLECDTSFDCTGGLVCCDFLLVKVCCSNGIRQPKYGDIKPSLIPLPGRGRNDNDGDWRQPPRPRGGIGTW